MSTFAISIIAKYVPARNTGERPHFTPLANSVRINPMSNPQDITVLFLEHTKRAPQRNVSLRPYSNFRIGGKADFFLEVSSIPDLKAAISLARRASLPFCVIGGGYNLLFDDEGYRGLIIKNEARGIEPCGEGEIAAVSGNPLSELVQSAVDRGIEGFEFLAGIPGTVGGAVSGNAGAFGRSIGDTVVAAELLDEAGLAQQVTRHDLEFGYRHSLFKKKRAVLLTARFLGQAGDKEKIKNKIAQNLESRKSKHPPENISCAGSYFKNPMLPDGTKIAAGFLLEQVGAKDLRVGDAAVYAGHANFIINLGNASAREVRFLARELKERVRAKFGLELEEEVIYLPATSSKL